MPPRRKLDRTRRIAKHRPSVLELQQAEEPATALDEIDDDEPLSNLRKPRKQKQQAITAQEQESPDLSQKRRDSDDDDQEISTDENENNDQKDDDSNDEDFVDGYSEEEDEEELVVEEEETVLRNKKKQYTTPSSSKKKQQRQRGGGSNIAVSRTTTTRKTSKKELACSSSSSSSSSEEEALSTRNKNNRRRSIQTIKKKKKTRRRLSSSVLSDEDDSSENEEEKKETSRGRSSFSTPRRRRASLAIKAATTTTTPRSKRKRTTSTRRGSSRKQKHDSDEDEFVPDDDDEEEDEEEVAVQELSSADDDDHSEEEPPVGVAVVRDQDVGFDDDSSSDDEDGTKKKKRMPYESPKLDLRLRKQRTTNDNFADLNDDSSGSSSDSDDAQNGGQDGRTAGLSSSTPPCRMPACPSTHDVVTAEELPEIHLCFFPPDGQSRQCFALETLRKIALSTGHPRFRNDVRSSGGKQTFLQPPHFRTAMDDDLLDQIASRFGRDALDLHGDYYRRNDPNRQEWRHVEARISMGSNNLHESEAFIDQLQQYMRSRMGNSDPYVCPLCYLMAYKQTMIADEGGNSGSKHKYPTEFKIDPMSILGSLDNENWRLAGSCCFKKLASVKQHLRNDHHVDTTVVQVQGNELYKRFKIRGQDGLLQRYLKNSAGRLSTRQGDMMSYWFGGNNECFLLLLSYITHAEVCREIVAKGEDNQSDPEAFATAEEFLQPAESYFDSFADEANEIWDVVASPFKKESREEIRDFLAAEDEELDEEENGMSHQALAMQTAMEDFEKSQHVAEQRASFYQSMEQEDDEDLDDDDAGDGDREFEDDVANGGYYEETSEQEDEWEKKIMSKRTTKGKGKSLSPRKRPIRRVSASGAKPSARKRITRPPDESSGEEEAVLPVPPASATRIRNRLAIQDESDEE